MDPVRIRDLLEATVGSRHVNSTAAPTARWSQRRRLGVVLGLNLSLVCGLVVVGFVARSLGVLAAAGDTVVDSIAIILGLVAVTIRDRNPDHPKANVPIGIAALLNGVTLLAVTVVVAIEAVRRLVHHADGVHGTPMFVVSAIAVVVLLVGALVLGASAADEDVHMRSVLVDTLADAAAAAGVAVAGAVIAITGRYQWLDPAIALIVCALVAVAATQLVVKAVGVLRGDEPDFDDD